MTSAVGRGLRLPLSITAAHGASPALLLAGGATSSSSSVSSASFKPCLVVLSHNSQARRSIATSSHPKNGTASNGSANDDALTAAAVSGLAPGLQRRFIHSSDRRTTSTFVEHPIPEPAGLLQPPLDPVTRAPLSVLPLSMILRSLATTTVSSSPVLLPPSLRIMAALASSESALLNPDRNPILRYFLKRSFYAQFCAGEDPTEVRSTVAKLKNIGFTGVILGYAKEVVLTEHEAKDLAVGTLGAETDEIIRKEIVPWTEGTLETVRLAEPGDYVALKFTGAGRLALYQLSNRIAPSPHLAKSIEAICQLAHERNVRLLFDAEQDALQDGIDDWTIQFARKFNRTPGKTVVHGTYQAYKKVTPINLANHLAIAKEDGFTLGVKLVRGAYLGSDPRDRLHDTKEETDACYNGIAASILTQQWSETIKGRGEYPSASLVLATHNAESVRRARAICDAGSAKSEIAFAQLQGMADEVSCELVEASISRQKESLTTMYGNKPALPVYKYLVWGTTGECMKYLLRRAEENKDAVQRTRSGRDAMLAEVVRRFKNAIGVGLA